MRAPSGQPLLSTTALRRLCEASVRVCLRDPSGRPLDLGRKVRNATPKQRRALHERDRGHCRFPGCTQCRRLIPHHVDWWGRDHGATDLDNLLLICPSHHRAVHEVGYQISALGDGQFRFTRPDGTDLPEHPRLQPADPERTDRTVVTGPWQTPVPLWGGEPLDLSHLIDGRAANHLNATGTLLPDIPYDQLEPTLRKATGWPAA